VPVIPAVEGTALTLLSRCCYKSEVVRENFQEEGTQTLARAAKSLGKEELRILAETKGQHPETGDGGWSTHGRDVELEVLRGKAGERWVLRTQRSMWLVQWRPCWSPLPAKHIT
jgi:hypothetical protein